MKKSVTAKQETEHSAEELADGVIAHAEVGIHGAVAGLGSDAIISLGRLLCAAGDADAILVVAGHVCRNDSAAVSADHVVGAIAVVNILQWFSEPLSRVKILCALQFLHNKV